MIKMSTVLITPEIAQQWLKANVRNRPMNMATVRRLARQIRDGNWRMNGDTIRFSIDGVLLDGQHRLMAIVMSGVACQSAVIEGLPSEVFDTIDVGGRVRGLSDVLAIRGESNYTTLAASAQLALLAERMGDPYKAGPEAKPSPKELEEFISSHPDIRECASIAAGKKFCSKYVTKALTAWVMYEFRRADMDKAMEFVRLLETGVGLAVGSPVLALRDRLISEGGSKVHKLDRRYKAMITFKAAQLFLDGATVRAFRVRRDGDCPESVSFRVKKGGM